MTEREKFEKWFFENGFLKSATIGEKMLMLQAWKAAKAQAVPEGWKLVPIDPTQEVFDAAFHAPSVGHPETSGQ